MTPTVNFDRATATVQRGRFSGNYSLWKDADGNLQLVCISDHTGGRVLLKKRMLDAFRDLTCGGSKSIAFLNTYSGYKHVTALEDLRVPDLLESSGYSPFYLFGEDVPQTQDLDYPL